MAEIMTPAGLVVGLIVEQEPTPPTAEGGKKGKTRKTKTEDVPAEGGESQPDEE